tara:strand:+ start:135 stop:296 length:162 start_codon:yes stop_codon:yes gene_type:complete
MGYSANHYVATYTDNNSVEQTVYVFGADVADAETKVKKIDPQAVNIVVSSAPA